MILDMPTGVRIRVTEVAREYFLVEINGRKHSRLRGSNHRSDLLRDRVPGSHVGERRGFMLICEKEQGRATWVRVVGWADAEEVDAPSTGEPRVVLTWDEGIRRFVLTELSEGTRLTRAELTLLEGLYGRDLLVPVTTI